MKPSIRKAAFATIVTMVFLASALHAQAQNVGRVQIPFSFEYGTEHFAGGTYTLYANPVSHLLSISGPGGTGTAMTMQSSYNAMAERNVVRVQFKKYGDRYFLEQVRSAGREIDVLESGAERRTAREFASRGEQPQTIAVAPVPQPVLGH